MSSAENLRSFISERLTAAAEEIFGVFHKVIVEYEEEIDRQRRLLDITWKPDIKLHRIELPQQHVYQEEKVLTHQQLSNQERNTSLDQEDSKPPQIKEEQEDLCNQGGEQLVLKQETDTFMLTPVSVENDLQLFSNNCHVAENQDQKGGKHEDSRSARNTEAKPKTQQHKGKSQTNNVYNTTMLETHHNTNKDKESLKCDTCGKEFKFRSHLKRHLRIHTGEKLYHCKTCGKDFNQRGHLTVHMRIHTGEKPYHCKTCGKDFNHSSTLVTHMRIHRGQKPYHCKTCGKDFNRSSTLAHHVRIHTGEKPYHCKTCGKDFNCSSHLARHMRIHAREKSYICQSGKGFRQSGALSVHVGRLHADAS